MSDGVGGAIISWLDFLKYGTSIMAQHINSNGNRQWVEDGVTICWSVFNFHQICSDGAGGAIITWDDFRNDDVVLGIYEHNIDIYAQKIDSYGRIKWSMNGLAICTEYEGQSNPQLVSDGKGGAIITWRDGRLIGLMDSNIYAQKTIVSDDSETPFNYFIMLILLISIISIALILISFALILRRRSVK